MKRKHCTMWSDMDCVMQALCNVEYYGVCNVSVPQYRGSAELQTGWGISRNHANAPKHLEV
eukprot:1302927-Ditylum_brightwellii.AAC.1